MERLIRVVILTIIISMLLPGCESAKNKAIDTQKEYKSIENQLQKNMEEMHEEFIY